MASPEISRRSKLSFPRVLIAIAAFSSLACGQGTQRSFVEEFVKGYLALSPTAATSQGYHQDQGVLFDELLDDYSPGGIEKSRSFAKRELAKAESLLKGSVDAEDRADLELIRLQCELTLLDSDKIQAYRHNPTLYVETVGNAIYTPLVLEYAPLDERVQHILARLDRIPVFLKQAKENLKDSPDLWRRVAIEENQGNRDLIANEVKAKMPAKWQERYQSVSSRALTALADFDKYLKTDLSQHTVKWQLGPDLYAKKFRLVLATGESPEQTLKAAEAELTRIRESMRADSETLYSKFYPGRTAPKDANLLISQVLDKVAEQHATPESYFAEARNDLAEATSFVESHQLLRLQGSGNLQVIETPSFMRGTYGVGGFSPAPVLQPKLGAFYWITPITSDMSAERVESKLREYNTWGLEILTIHEAMPGHYVQAEYAARVQPEWRGALRAIFGNGPYVEGWAVYATQLMIEQGYRNSPEMRLTFGKQMLRVVANTILDVRLQTKEMTDQQALDLMIKDTFQERQEAEKKLQRAKLSSCQLPTYFVGWRGWEQVRNAFRIQSGSQFWLADFHAKALNEGAVPLPVLGSLLGIEHTALTNAN